MAGVEPASRKLIQKPSTNIDYSSSLEFISNE